MAKYLATSFAILKVVKAPRVINNCLPISTTSINLDPDNKLQKVFAQDEKETSLIKDKAILEKPNDNMVIVEEPLPDEDFVESGDAYLTISTIFKGN